ncbi:copper resistance CopC family protein [Kineosporia sp. NBRC 101731]|uniref:copper resistance CopC family protein n=1 Tax=Kineosporia sp. NBRC 101731 TaxID=3032199 RepID=UPI0024A11466|nr:copper resistance CopC family protein [Kineosporia sp. NBRC 101731]GLY29616.1 hypothetical protein Kisp02_29810 [Kineosporia sp. NBRC 101731]
MSLSYRLSRRLGAVLALAGAVVVLGAGPALAHDELGSSNPADGSSVKTLPDVVKLEFSADILELGARVRVDSPEGDVTEGKATLKGNTLSQAVAPGSPAGDYTVTWRVTSSDGHPISGKFAFTAQQGNEPAAVETTTAPVTSSAAAPSPTASATAVTQAGAATAEDSGGSSAPLVILLVVLGVLAVGAAVYVVFVVPRRSSQN